MLRGRWRSSAMLMMRWARRCIVWFFWGGGVMSSSAIMRGSLRWIRSCGIGFGRETTASNYEHDYERGNFRDGARLVNVFFSSIMLSSFPISRRRLLSCLFGWLITAPAPRPPKKTSSSAQTLVSNSPPLQNLNLRDLTQFIRGSHITRSSRLRNTRDASKHRLVRKGIRNTSSADANDSDTGIVGRAIMRAVSEVAEPGAQGRGVVLVYQVAVRFDARCAC